MPYLQTPVGPLLGRRFTPTFWVYENLQPPDFKRTDMIYDLGKKFDYYQNHMYERRLHFFRYMKEVGFLLRP